MKNVLVLTYWSYKNALIQTYTLPYVRIIKRNLPPNSKIFLLTIEQEYFKMTDNEWEEEVKILNKEGIYPIRIQYDHFGIKMMFKLFSLVFSLKKIIRKENIDFIHAWCTPAGALGYILSVFTKKPLIIDSYEPHAEAMVENGSWKKSNLKFKLLFWLEKKQSKKANTVIALTEGMKSYAKDKYGASFTNYYIKPALVNLDKFKWDEISYKTLRKKHEVENKIVCLYAGKLGGIYLEEEVFDFFKVAHSYWQEKLKIYLLTDKNINEVNHFIRNKGIPESCIETKFIHYNDISEYFQLADFAINPVKPVPSKRYCTSIKDGEYWAAGLPVVITKDISDDSNIIHQNEIGYVLNALTHEEYEKACQKIDVLLQLGREQINNSIVKIAKKYRSYEIANDVYKNIYL